MQRSFQPEGPCHVCGASAELADIVVRLGDGRWAHLPCTREGVRRWCREGRPEGGPLEWDRTALPRWHAGDAADRHPHVVRKGGWARPALGWVMRQRLLG